MWWREQALGGGLPVIKNLFSHLQDVDFMKNLGISVGRFPPLSYSDTITEQHPLAIIEMDIAGRFGDYVMDLATRKLRTMICIENGYPQSFAGLTGEAGYPTTVGRMEMHSRAYDAAKNVNLPGWRSKVRRCPLGAVSNERLFLIAKASNFEKNTNHILQAAATEIFGAGAEARRLPVPCGRPSAVCDELQVPQLPRRVASARPQQDEGENLHRPRDAQGAQAGRVKRPSHGRSASYRRRTRSPGPGATGRSSGCTFSAASPSSCDCGQGREAGGRGIGGDWRSGSLASEPGGRGRHCDDHGSAARGLPEDQDLLGHVRDRRVPAAVESQGARRR